MEVVIDGYNLLMKVGRLAARLQGGEISRAREMLLYLLARSRRRELHSATVFFDSRRLNPGRMPGPEGIGLRIQRESRGELGVVFSPPGVEADTVIKEYLEERALVGKAGQVTVVTSDRAVASYARGLGARIETSEECAKALVGHQRPRHGAPDRGEPTEAAKELTAPGDDEVQAWLKYFGIEGDGKVEF